MKFLDYEKLGLLNQTLAHKEIGDKVLTGKIEAYSCKPASDDRMLIKELKSTYSSRGTPTGNPSSVPSTTTTHEADSPPLLPSVNGQRLPPQSHLALLSTSLSGPSNTIPSPSKLSYLRVSSLPNPAQPFFPTISASSNFSSPLGDLSDPSTRKLLVNLIATMNAAFPDYNFSGLRPEQFMLEPDFRLTINHVNRHLADLGETLGASFLEELWAALDEAALLKDCEIFSYLPDMDGDPFSDGNLWSFNYFFVNRKIKRIVFFTCMAKSKFQSLDGDDSDSSPMRISDEYEEQYWVDL